MVVVALDFGGVGMEGIAVKVVAKFFAGAADFAKGAGVVFFGFTLDSKIKKFECAIESALKTGGFVLVFE